MTIYYFLFFVFLFVSLVVFGAYRYYAVDKQSMKIVNERLRILNDLENSELAIEILRSRRGIWLLTKNSRFKNVSKRLVQTGLDLGRELFIKIAISIIIFNIVIISIVGFYWYTALIAPISSIFLVVAFFERMRAVRIAKFESQLPDALEIIVRSLRAGHPTQTAIALAARECPDPIGSEFGLASDEIRHGLDISSALRNMSERVGMPDLIYVEAAVAVQSQSGGSLSEVIARLSKIIRERFKLRQKVAALTSEGRISGVVLTGVPVGIGLAITLTTPSYYGESLHDPIFHNAMILAAVLLLLGHISIQKLLKFTY